MIADERQATARLGGQAFSGLASLIEGVHRAVAGRAFRATGSVGGPVQVIHDAVASTVYSGLRVGGSAAAMAAAELAPLVGSATRPAGATRRGNQILAGLNALAGDALDRQANPLAIRMAVRCAGDDVAPTPAALAAAFPAATSRLAVFVHGLAETEESWVRPAADGIDRGYGVSIQQELGYTPVYVRYNTGLHISDNGRSLADLLDAIVGGWPTRAERVVLIGHSMGGLVIRSACHLGATDRRAWTPLVSEVVYLGTPHLGAPLARAAGRAGWAFNRLPETRPFTPLVNGSSAGIQDLRFGYVLEEEWSGCDPNECQRNHRRHVPLMDTANHAVISVTVTADPHSPVGAVVGDLLVQPASAHGRDRRGRHIAFPVETGRRLGGLNHFDLLGNPLVWAEIQELLKPAA